MVNVFTLFWGGKSKYYKALLGCHGFAESSKFLSKQLVLLSNFSNRSFQKLLFSFIKFLPRPQKANISKPFYNFS